ncbi:MAG: VOC family protein [Verrucomicrobiota bacterium]
MVQVEKDRQANSEAEIATFLTFQNNDAEQAMNFYIELFDNSKVLSLQRWEKGGQGKEGTIMHASFVLNGNKYMCSDSPPIHDWDFTPAVSNFVECKDQQQLEGLFTKLSAKGSVLMPLNNYGFSKMFGYVQDQFGVSWQLNLD